MASTRIFGVVISKFSYYKEPNLMILLVVNKSPKVGFYHTILRLSLAVNLRMEGDKKSSLNLKEVIE